MRCQWGIVVLLALLISASALAADDAGRAEVAFSEGLLAYNNQNYNRAERDFSKAVSLNPKLQKAQHFLGMTEYQLGRYEAAQQAFGAAIALGDVASATRFYRGLSLYRIGQMTQARSDFVRAQELAPPGDIDNLSSSYVRNIDSGEEIQSVAVGESKRWYVYASYSTSYDSNVSLNPDNLALANLPSDSRDAEFALRGGGGYHVVDTKHLKITPEAFYYQSLHPRLTGFNYGLAHIGLQNKFIEGRWTMGIPTTYEFSTLGSTKFLGVVAVNPNVTYFWMNRMLTQIGMPTSYDDFFQTVTNNPQDRDAWNLLPGITQYVFFNDKKHYVALAYNYEKNWASGNDWDYHANTIVASGLLPLPWQMDLYVFGSFTFDKNFNNVDSVIGTRRKDTLYMAGANLTRKFFKYMDVTLHYNYWNENSNQAFFTYDRNLVGVTFGVAY
ncbi:MAG: hypothetical protein COV45_00310 [Deltaproteobacteria bacterium CG11_big_fil_rev_8_21_14_0_20_47_16]|nr:MAG: hypothetical protein COV45_00310 [Deltaproteobacteria bacterium CG11_big_fil_rev_8_21_14_0_20_47_16]